MDSTVFGAWPQAPIPHSVVIDVSKLSEYLRLTVPHRWVERTPITLSTAPSLFLPLLALIVMAGLARTPATLILRLSLLPLALAVTLIPCFGYYFEAPQLNALNHALQIIGVLDTPYLLFLAFARDGVLKMNEVAPGVAAPLSETASDCQDLIKSRSSQTSRITASSFLGNGLELLWNIRGIGWKFGSGTGVYVTKDRRNLSDRSIFLRQTLLSIATHILVIDVSNSILAYSGVRAPGGTLFGRGSNALESLIISTFLASLASIYLSYTFNLVHLISSFIAISFRASDKPLQDEGWGPLIDNPWVSTSLHEYWGVRWHQAFRQHFLVLGGYPLQSIMRTIVLHCPVPISTRARKAWAKGLGNAGLLLGVFLASGLMHNVAIYASGPVVNPTTGAVFNDHWSSTSPTMVYFVAQSIGLALERFYKVRMGKPVSGLLGSVWVWLWIMGGGQIVFDSWYRAGFLRDWVIPPLMSPTEQIILPLVKKHLITS